MYRTALGLIFALNSGIALAQSEDNQPTPITESAVMADQNLVEGEWVEVDLVGDANAGAASAAICAACHGADGNSSNPLWPSLAGQHADYLVRQLQLFKSGGRYDPQMSPMALPLQPQEMADLAAFFASQSRKPGVADEQYVEQGARLYRTGNDEGAPPCMACHGPAGRGVPLAGYPALAGQHADYLVKTLRAFRDGMVWGRDEHANPVMMQAAARLSDEEIQALASYLEGLY